MPKPRKNEKKKGYLKRCIPIVKKEGTSTKQACAICFSYWNKRNESMKFKFYNEYLTETENVKVDKELREFNLTHKQNDMFELKSKDFLKDFSVSPYKNEVLDKLKQTFNTLIDAIDEENAEKLYARITKAESLDYNYGSVFQSKFSLINIPEIDAHLTDDQRTSLKTSEREFLLNNYSQLPKAIKTDILSELVERAQILCCVIEALFYRVRDTDKNNYYNGLATDEIIEEYEKAIEKSSKDLSFSYEGPSISKEQMTPIKEDTQVAYWLCEKDLKKFTIFGTISVKELYAEENIGGTRGLKLSISGKDLDSQEKDYNFFDVNELGKRINMFYKKILNK